jgi:hypothetical protein
VVLHYSWVNKSLIAGHPLVESSNWGDCKVTPDNVNSNFGYVPPPTSSNFQLQTPRPTPENRSYSFSTPSSFSQGSACVMPPSSQPHTPNPSRWPPDPVMLQQQTPQLPPANQFTPYNSQLMQPPNVFSPFPMSQPTDTGTMTYSQQSAWPSFQPGQYNMVQPSPTLEDFRRAYEVMMMWFQRPAMYQQLPPPPTPTQSNPFHPPPPPPTQDPPSISRAQLDAPRISGSPFATMMSRQDSMNSNDTHDLGDLSAGLPPGTPSLSVPPHVESEPIPTPPPLDITAGPSVIHTHPKLFEYDVGRPMMFCIPITLKNRGKIAEIFRVSLQLP